jgi:hypothetical protein
MINLIFLRMLLRNWFKWKANVAVNEAGWEPLIFGLAAPEFSEPAPKISYCDSLEKNK